MHDENYDTESSETDLSNEEYNSNISDSILRDSLSTGDKSENEGDLSSEDENATYECENDGFLKIFYTNADNLMNKLDELKVRSYDKNYDIIIITEVYPKFGDSRETQNIELQINGYNLYSSRVEKNSRGVIIYVKETIRSDKNIVLTNYDFNESVWVNIYLKNEQKLLIGGIYRSPNSSPENTIKMIDLINIACNENYMYVTKVLVGDYNIPEIDWLSWNTIKSESHYSFKFLECLRDNYLEQLVHMPTRWRDQQPGNLLDLVLTDCEDNILNLETANHLGNSDHLSIEFLINCSTENYVNEVEKRNFYRADYVSANQKLLNENWDVLQI